MTRPISAQLREEIISGDVRTRARREWPRCGPRKSIWSGNFSMEQAIAQAITHALVAAAGG